ncbi:hypothetical protein COL940_003597 [Colletotrichum noveboracense]|nr:hypothetical protein COL940_003597 [Colletotrichum noveboracense]
MAFDALELWRDLVTAYSQCRFTRPEDKLYAFSGIAKLFQKISRGSMAVTSLTFAELDRLHSKAKAAIPISGAFLVLGIGRWAF